MNPVLEQLDEVSRSLDSLAVVEENDKYYYDPSAKQFYKSGAPVVNLVSYFWGKGHATKFLQGCSRTVSGESHVYFATGLIQLEKSLIDVIESVREAQLEEKKKTAELKAVIRSVETLCARVKAAAAGILRLMDTTYQNESLKRDMLKVHQKEFKGKLSERIQLLFVDLVNLVKEKDHDSDISEEVNKWCLQADEMKPSLKQIMEKRRNKEIERLNSQPNPDTGLSRNDLKKLREFIFSKSEGPRLRRQLKKKIKHYPENPFLYLRPTYTKFSFPVHYCSDEIVVHPKIFLGKGRYKIVSKSVVYKGPDDKIGVVFANGVSKFCRKPELINEISTKKVADNERYFLILFKGSPGIIPVHSIFRYSCAKDKRIVKQSVLMPYCKYGDLSDYIQKRHIDLTEEQKKLILLDVLRGLSTIHEIAVHQDIKPHNILIKNDKNGAYISDFGMCRLLESKDSSGGSPLYMSPEVMRVWIERIKKPSEYLEEGMDLEKAKEIKAAAVAELKRFVSAPSDMWSLGCTGWQFLNGTYTPQMECVSELRFDPKVMDKLMDETAIPEPEKGTVLHLFWRMLRPKPEDRPTAEEAKKEMERLLF